jgi:hypothetical protein
MVCPLILLFQLPDGSEIAKTFRRKPLGLHFQEQSGRVVTKVRGEAMALGVQQGWTLMMIADETVHQFDFATTCRKLWAAADSLRDYLIVRRHSPERTATADMGRTCQSPTDSPETVLQRYGYTAATEHFWDHEPQPILTLGLISRHTEIGIHTWYDMHCRLVSAAPVQDRAWVVPRRLAHVRSLVHDPVKRELGEARYRKLFAERFAHRGGLPGTTVKLEAWLSALAKSINDQQLSPKLTATVLLFLEAPEMDDDSNSSRWHHSVKQIPVSKFGVKKTPLSKFGLQSEAVLDALHKKELLVPLPPSTKSVQHATMPVMLGAFKQDQPRQLEKRQETSKMWPNKHVFILE